MENTAGHQSACLWAKRTWPAALLYIIGRDQALREGYHARSRPTTTAALVVSLVLIVYPNALAVLCWRWGWDQWHAFMLGNTLLGLGLLLYTFHAGLWSAVWGRVSGAGLWAGAAAGAVPLLVILALMALPGQLGRDIVASGIGEISVPRFWYRVGVQVALSTVLCEEFAFRGLLQALLAPLLPASGAVLLGAAIFGLWHTALQYNGFASQRGLTRLGATVGGTVVYGFLGALLGFIRLRSGGLASAIVAHGILDLGMFVGMLVRRQYYRRGH